jgi:hypothetical protein
MLRTPLLILLAMCGVADDSPSLRNFEGAWAVESASWTVDDAPSEMQVWIPGYFCFVGDRMHVVHSSLVSASEVLAIEESGGEQYVLFEQYYKSLRRKVRFWTDAGKLHVVIESRLTRDNRLLKVEYVLTHVDKVQLLRHITTNMKLIMPLPQEGKSISNEALQELLQFLRESETANGA